MIYCLSYIDLVATSTCTHNSARDHHSIQLWCSNSALPVEKEFLIVFISYSRMSSCPTPSTSSIMTNCRPTLCFFFRRRRRQQESSYPLLLKTKGSIQDMNVIIFRELYGSRTVKSFISFHRGHYTHKSVVGDSSWKSVHSQFGLSLSLTLCVQYMSFLAALFYDPVLGADHNNHAKGARELYNVKSTGGSSASLEKSLSYLKLQRSRRNARKVWQLALLFP